MKTIFKNYGKKTFGNYEYVYNIKDLSALFGHVSTLEEILEEYILSKFK